MRIIVFIFFLFVSGQMVAQTPLRHIRLKNNVRAVTIVEYDRFGKVFKRAKTWYSRNGEDSLVYYDSILVARFITQKDERGRTTSMEKIGKDGQKAETRIFTYNPDGSYVIVATEHGPKYSLVIKEYYNAANICYMTLMNNDTTLSTFDSAGRLYKIFHLNKGKKEELVVFNYDKDGNIKSTGDPSQKPIAMYAVYKNNERGLPVEIISYFKKKGTTAKATGRKVFEYEYYHLSTSSILESSMKSFN